MKILFSATALLITLFAHGQVKMGVFAGPQVTDVRYMVNAKKQDHSMKIGVNTGLQLKIPFEGRLSFSPSVMYNLRGYKVKLNAPSILPDSTASDNNTSFHTIELGFLLQHDFKLQPGHFFFRIGPSLDFALFGKENFNIHNDGRVNRKMKFGFADYGHYLASAIFQLGFEAKDGLFIYGHYNYSLTTMNNSDDGPVIGNRAVGFTIGKYFK